MEWIFDRSEEVVRAKIAEWRDGSYEAECYVDHDGVELDKPRLIKITVKIDGDSVAVDFAGSSETTTGPINCPLVANRAAVGISLLSLTVPREPVNAGHLRPLEVTAPENTMLNPLPPAPCDSFGYVNNRALDLFFKALSDALPDQAPAGTHQLYGVYLYRMDPRFGKPFIYIEPMCGGYGARPSVDGASGLIFIGDGDCHNTPVEIVEGRYPLLMERHALDTGSAGAGKYRGGLGVIRDYRMLTDDVMLANAHDSKVTPPWGLFGGAEGSIPRVIEFFGTDKQNDIMERTNFYGPFHTGDVLSVRSSGGGGWGDPLDRDPNFVEQDVLLDYVSEEEALDVYGVVIQADGSLDQDATTAVRSTRGENS
jgi:N-methylhydantoinase B